MFANIRSLARIAAELRRIANSLEYFAIQDARRNNQLFIVKRSRFGKDESELMHTDDAHIAQLRDEEHATFLQRGYQPDTDDSPESDRD